DQLTKIMGLDKENASEVVPLFGDKVEGFLKGFARKFCIETFSDVVAVQGELPAEAGRVHIGTEMRQFLEGLIDENLNVEALLKDTPYADIPEIKDLEPHVKKYALDTASDFLVHLAAGYAPEGETDIELLPNALSQLLELAGTVPLDQIKKLKAMPEGK